MAHILVIEDDVPTRRGVIGLLRREGYEVAEAGTGVEAMRLLQTEAFDVVVTDINMPEMDGIEVIMRLRKLESDVPIVAMSGGGHMPKELLLDSAELLGAVEAIAKPLEPRELVAAVSRALERRMGGVGPFDFTA